MLTAPSVPFAVSRNGEAITEAPLKNKRAFVSAGIEASLDYIGFDAAVAAHLDLQKWDAGGYPRHTMARVIAWHKLSGLITMHQQDAAIKKPKGKG